MLSVLIDPDKAQAASLNRLLDEVEDLADVFFIGGSLMTEDALDETLDRLKSRVDKPCILFPGSAIQVSRKADALLMLSLISGRNAELLIGQQVVAAPRIKAFGLETLSVGYMLVDGGSHNSLVHQSIAAHTVGQTRDRCLYRTRWLHAGNETPLSRRRKRSHAACAGRYDPAGQPNM